MTLVGRRRYKQAERPPVLPLWLHIQLSLTHSKQYLLNTHTPSKKVQWYHCWIVFPLGSMKSKERESGLITQFIFRQNTWLCWIGRKYEYKYKYNYKQLWKTRRCAIRKRYNTHWLTTWNQAMLAHLKINPQTQHSALLDRIKGRQQEVQILEEQLRWIYSI